MANSLELMSLGHRGDKNTGGTCERLNVVWLSDLHISTDYALLFNSFKEFGIIQRMKLKVNPNQTAYDGYVTFSEHISAKKAFDNYLDQPVGKSKPSLKLLKAENVKDDEYDYIPPLHKQQDPSNEIERPKPQLIWHVASYKENRSNFTQGIECLEEKVGPIPKENIKRYRKRQLGNDGPQHRHYWF